MVLAWQRRAVSLAASRLRPAAAPAGRAAAAAERFTEIVRAVGRQVKDASRVEVPFECVIPADPSGGPPTAAAASTCPWAGPGP